MKITTLIKIILVCGLVFSISNAANLVFSDDFESGNLDSWDTGDRVTTANVHTGKYALERNVDGWWGSSHFLDRELHELYMSFWWYYVPDAACPTGGGHFWRLTYATPQQFQIRQIDSQGGWDCNSNFQYVFFWGGEGAMSTVVFPVKQWFHFEFYVKFNDPGQANGQVALWIDGKQEVNLKDKELRGSSGDDLHGVNMIRMFTNRSDLDTVIADDLEIWDGLPTDMSMASIATAELPAGAVGQPYAQQLQADGGKAPYEWSVVSGGLHPGLLLNAATGAITGTPEIVQRRKITFQVKDSQGNPSIATKELYLDIQASAAVASVVGSAGINSGELGIAAQSNGGVDLVVRGQAGEAFDLEIVDAAGRSIRSWNGQAGNARLSMGQESFASKGLHVAVLRKGGMRIAKRFLVF